MKNLLKAFIIFGLIIWMFPAIFMLFIGALALISDIFGTESEATFFIFFAIVVLIILRLSFKVKK